MTIPPLVGITPPKPHEAAPLGTTGIFTVVGKSQNLFDFINIFRLDDEIRHCRKKCFSS